MVLGNRRISFLDSDPLNSLIILKKYDGEI